MPHIIVEYSANLQDKICIADLLEALSESVLARRDDAGQRVFPLGGLRARALRYDDYRIADAAADYAFIHVTIRIGAGRSEAIERGTATAAFQAMTGLVAPLLAGQLVALSLDLDRFNEWGTLKANNIHAHLKAMTNG